MAAASGADLVQQLQTAPWGAEPQWHFEENLKYDVGETAAETTSAVRCANHTCSARFEGQQEPGSSSSSSSSSSSGNADDAVSKGEADANAAPGSTQKQLRCGKCRACYCSRECQVKSWKMSHKRECALVAAFAEGSTTEKQRHEVVEDMLRRIRMYMCPFAAGFSLLHGKGFVLLRSNATLRDWIYEHPADAEGRLLQRSVQLQYLTLGEFDGLAFEDDFELAAVRPKLEEALEAYEVQKQVVVVVLLKCGFFACVTVPMVPEFAIGKQLAAMYKYVEMEGPLQLNVDDTE